MLDFAERFASCVSAESGGADAKTADSQRCWTRVRLSSRYVGLIPFSLQSFVPLSKTHKQNNHRTAESTGSLSQAKTFMVKVDCREIDRVRLFSVSLLMLLAFLSSCNSVCLCLCLLVEQLPAEDYRVWAHAGPTLGQEGSGLRPWRPRSQKLTRSVGMGCSALSPAASCQWGMLTLIDGPARCQDWQHLVCGVHYRACEGSLGENSVWHTSCYRQIPLYVGESKKDNVSYILGNVASMIFDVLWLHEVVTHTDEVWTSVSVTVCAFNGERSYLFLTYGKESCSSIRRDTEILCLSGNRMWTCVCVLAFTALQ